MCATSPYDLIEPPDAPQDCKRRPHKRPCSQEKRAFVWLVAFVSSSDQFPAALQRDFVQANVLDGGPDNRETTGLRREDVDLIRALSHIAEETLNGIGRLNKHSISFVSQLRGRLRFFLIFLKRLLCDH